MSEGADYPGAAWIGADATNFRAAGRPLSAIRRVGIHCTSGRADPYAVARMWQQPNHGSSATFVIGQDGTILQCVRISDIAWHAHKASLDSIGIEHCARAPGELGPGDPGLPVSDAQYAASARLVAWFCWRAALAPDRDTIQGHVEMDPETTHENCPTELNVGKSATWDWIRFMQLVTDEYAKLSTPSV